MNNQEEKKEMKKKTEVGVRPKTNVGQKIGIAIAGLGILALITGTVAAMLPGKQIGTTPAVDSGGPTCYKPGTFNLLTPANGAIDQDDEVTLTWSTSSRATSYDVYFGTTSSPAKITTVTTTSYEVTQLLPTTTYYWKIVAKNNCGTRSSPIWNFSTADLQWFIDQGYDISEYDAACGGQRGCDEDYTGITCAEFGSIFQICDGVNNKCPDSLAEKCLQQSLCQCSGHPAGEPACATWFDELEDPCL